MKLHVVGQPTIGLPRTHTPRARLFYTLPKAPSKRADLRVTELYGLPPNVGAKLVRTCDEARALIDAGLVRCFDSGKGFVKCAVRGSATGPIGFWAFGKNNCALPTVDPKEILLGSNIG